MTELYTQHNSPWHLSRIVDEEDQFIYRKTGKGVSVYILDTGMNLNHEEFNGNREVKTVYSYDGQDYDLDGYGPDHGTAVASCVGGKVCGPAKEANLYNLRFDMRHSSAREAAEEVLSHKGSYPAILVKSFGGPFPLFNEELEELENNGVILVAAAGNESQNISRNKMFPASKKRTISVGATNRKDHLSKFSNYGNMVDILAPGSNIQVATANGYYSYFNGTSFAAPIVAGVIAQIVQDEVVSDEQDVNEVKEILYNNAFKDEIRLSRKERKTSNLLVNSLAA